MFFSGLNSSPAVQSCISPALNALQSNNAPSISSLCAATTSNTCPDSTMRSWLAYFRGNCTNELLTNPNQQVVGIYTSFYAIKPFLNAVCAKDTATGSYCLSQLGSNSTAKAAGGMANAAQQPLADANGVPNAEAFSNANILWLGANPNMDAASLCTTCTKNVLTSYIQWESANPPAVNIAR